jgi:hypothetical protein
VCLSPCREGVLATQVALGLVQDSLEQRKLFSAGLCLTRCFRRLRISGVNEVDGAHRARAGAAFSLPQGTGAAVVMEVAAVRPEPVSRIVFGARERPPSSGRQGAPHVVATARLKLASQRCRQRPRKAGGPQTRAQVCEDDRWTLPSSAGPSTARAPRPKTRRLARLCGRKLTSFQALRRRRGARTTCVPATDPRAGHNRIGRSKAHIPFSDVERLSGLVEVLLSAAKRARLPSRAQSRPQAGRSAARPLAA